jgi:hypothetical protein
VATRPLPADEDDPNTPFPVASANEVNIISMDARDADALVMSGQPIMGPFELAAPEDIEVLKAEPPWQGAPVPRLGEGAVPMIVAASIGEAQEP